jgi:hypothetical protein
MHIEYMSASGAASKLGVSRSSVARAARSQGVGIFVEGRLVALDPRDLDRMKPALRETPGNPNWIALRGKTAKRKKKQNA